jgi:hypothetical protein
MAKFRLNSNSVFTFGGDAVTCVTEVTLDETADDYMSNCAGLTTREHIAGVTNITGSASCELETDGATQYNLFAPGSTGALVLSPASNTAGDITFTSTNMTILGRSPAFSSGGLTTFSFTFALDNLTIAAISA